MTTYHAIIEFEFDNQTYIPGDIVSTGVYEQLSEEQQLNIQIRYDFYFKMPMRFINDAFEITPTPSGQYNCKHYYDDHDAPYQALINTDEDFTGQENVVVVSKEEGVPEIYV